MYFRNCITQHIEKSSPKNTLKNEHNLTLSLVKYHFQTNLILNASQSFISINFGTTINKIAIATKLTQQ